MQVFVNGVLVGGADETIGEIESGRFRERIKNASNPPLPPSVERAVDQAREAKKESVSIAISAGFLANFSEEGGKIDSSCVIQPKSM